MKSETLLLAGARKVEVTSLTKVFYPETGFTKGEVIDYYVRVAPVLLPHLKDRPITLKRYPDGVEGIFFYEKQCPSHRPAWMKTAAVGKKDGSLIDYCVINDLASLIWAANLADLELHTFLHKSRALQRPTALAFDLDPGPPADIRQCCEVAIALNKLLRAAGLESFPKTSGSKGLQVFAPLNTAVNYDDTKEFAQTVAHVMESKHPQLVVSRMTKALRRGKVFIDWSQNDDKKTTVNVYSLRAKSVPSVSTPVTWKEVERAASRREPISFESREVLLRVKKHGDLFEPVLTMKQKLPKAAVLEE